VRSLRVRRSDDCAPLITVLLPVTRSAVSYVSFAVFCAFRVATFSTSRVRFADGRLWGTLVGTRLPATGPADSDLVANTQPRGTTSASVDRRTAFGRLSQPTTFGRHYPPDDFRPSLPVDAAAPSPRKPDTRKMWKVRELADKV